MGFYRLWFGGREEGGEGREEKGGRRIRLGARRRMEGGGEGREKETGGRRRRKEEGIFVLGLLNVSITVGREVV